MHKALIFVAGSIAGAVALPATIMYVKPVRTKIAQVISKRIVKVLSDDPEARTDAIDIATDVTAALILIDEVKKAR